MSAKHRPVTVRRESAACIRPDRPEVSVSTDTLTIVAPAPAHSGWRTAALLYGGPWTAAVVVASVWYLGWGFPDGLLYRLLIWVVLMLLTAALHVISPSGGRRAVCRSSSTSCDTPSRAPGCCLHMRKAARIRASRSPHGARPSGWAQA